MSMTQPAAAPDGTELTAAAVAAQVLAGLFSEPGRADPYPLYRRLHALGPIVAPPDGSLVVSGYEMLSALLRDHRLTKKPERLLLASGYPDWQARPSLRLMYTSLLVSNPPVHTRLRRSVSAVFTARRVELLRPAVERIVAEACSRICGNCDFVTGFAFPVPVTVIGELLGVPASDRPMFGDLARTGRRSLRT
jgi:cytochrome P450